jgi:hypothetical protein
MPSNSQTQSDPAKSENPELNLQPGSPAKNFPPPRPVGGKSKQLSPSQAQRSGQHAAQNQQKRDQSAQRSPGHPEKPAPERDEDEIDVDRELTTPPARTTKDESI